MLVHFQEETKMSPEYRPRGGRRIADRPGRSAAAPPAFLGWRGAARGPPTTRGTVARWGVLPRKLPFHQEFRSAGSVPWVCHPGTMNVTATGPAPGACVSARVATSPGRKPKVPAPQRFGAGPDVATRH